MATRIKIIAEYETPEEAANAKWFSDLGEIDVNGKAVTTLGGREENHWYTQKKVGILEGLSPTNITMEPLEVELETD